AVAPGEGDGPGAGVGGGGRPGSGGGAVFGIDATIVMAHSEKEGAAPTWKRTFGFHPLVCFLDRPEIASGEALAGVVRPGNAGSNTAADHIAVLRRAVENLPEAARPGKDNPEAPRYVVRSDSAGATHDFAADC